MVSNRNLLFQGSIFRGYVSFREGKPSFSTLTGWGGRFKLYNDTLPKTNQNSPANRPKPKRKNHLSTIDFQENSLAVSFQGGYGRTLARMFFPCWNFYLQHDPMTHDLFFSNDLY